MFFVLIDIAERCGVDGEYIARIAQHVVSTNNFNQNNKKNNNNQFFSDRNNNKFVSDNSFSRINNIISNNPPSEPYDPFEKSMNILESFSSLISDPFSQFRISSSFSTQEAICRRFFNALILCDVANEIPWGDIARKFSTTCGAIQTLVSGAAINAQMLASFCKRIGWIGLEAVLIIVCKRLGSEGVKEELIPLTSLPGVGRSRARSLWNCGYRSVEDVANAEPEDLAVNVTTGFFCVF
jgi:replicative superfamily II helicase